MMNAPGRAALLAVQRVARNRMVLLAPAEYSSAITSGIPTWRKELRKTPKYQRLKPFTRGAMGRNRSTAAITTGTFVYSRRIAALAMYATEIIRKSATIRTPRKTSEINAARAMSLGLPNRRRVYDTRAEVSVAAGKEKVWLMTILESHDLELVSLHFH